jgi:cytochrome P450
VLWSVIVCGIHVVHIIDGAYQGRHNFREELHAVLIRRWLKDRRHITLPTLSGTAKNAIRTWLNKNSLVGKNTDSLQDPLLDLMAHVMSASVSGIDGHDNPELIAAYKGLSKVSVTVFGTSNLLPHWLAVVLSTLMTWPHWRKIKRILKPIIAARRTQTDQEDRAAKEHVRDLLTMFVDSTDDDERVAELVGGIVIGGLMVSTTIS